MLPLVGAVYSEAWRTLVKDLHPIQSEAAFIFAASGSFRPCSAHWRGPDVLAKGAEDPEEKEGLGAGEVQDLQM